MKTILTSRIPLVCLGTLALATTLTTTSHASLSLTGGTFTETFTALPAATSWSTPAANFGVDGNTITGDATADSLVGTPASPSGAVTAASTATQLLAGAAAGTVATAGQARHYSNGFVGTPPTGNGGNLLMATLTNNTGGPILSLSIAYDLGIQNNNVAPAAGTLEAEIPGHRVYWSLTGLANSWNPIGDFGFRATGVAADPATRTQGFSMGRQWLHGRRARMPTSSGWTTMPRTIPTAPTSSTTSPSPRRPNRPPDCSRWARAACSASRAAARESSPRL